MFRTLFAHHFTTQFNFILLIYSLEEECQQSSCSQTLEVRNMDLHATYKRFTAAFSKLETYVGLLAAASTKSCSHLQSNHRAFFDKLADCTQNLYEVMKGEIWTSVFDFNYFLSHLISFFLDFSNLQDFQICWCQKAVFVFCFFFHKVWL